MGQTESRDLLRGTLDMLILKALEREPCHGYAIALWIEHRSDDVLRVEEGALYPGLHRLELRGLVKASWGRSENNRRARFYRLTARGRRHLGIEDERWGALSQAVNKVMGR
jgi:PadR family transcriptional regulator